MPPTSGYGPLDMGRHNASPSDPANNAINYNEMVRGQMVSQYANQVPQPPQRNVWDEYRIARQPRYQYGVPGGQDQRRYRRQAELNSAAFGAGAMTTAMDWGAYGVAGGAAAAIGMTGAAAFFAPMAVAGLAMAPIASGVKYSLDRRKFMASMASDVEMYRDRMGFNSLSYNQATDLGMSVGRNMYQTGEPGGGGFFNREQQSRIQKIGLANNMLDARAPGGGINNIMRSGTIGQYKRNLDELTKTAEDAVKILNTTIEGAMSVVKEMKGQGLSTSQARQQLRQAAAYGGISGLGTQNMLQVAAAGAQMVQGTPWSAQTGSSMATHFTTSAALMSQASPTMQYAVQRAGGAAQAGMSLAAMQMNVLQSGVGTKLIAAAMNPDGSVNSKKLQDIMTRNYSGTQISSMANATGYAMGPGGRVMFPFDKQKAIEGMSNVERDLMSLAGFNAWRRGRSGNQKQQAYDYASMFSDDMRQQELFANSLISNPQWQTMHAAQRAQGALMMQGPEYAYQTPWQRVGNELHSRFMKPMITTTREIGEGLVGFGDESMQKISRVYKKASHGIANASLDLLGIRGSNYVADYGMTYEEALGQATGANAMLTPQEAISAKAFQKKYNSTGQTIQFTGASNVISSKQLMAIAGNERAFNTIARNLTQASVVGTNQAATAFMNDTNVLQALGVTRFGDIGNPVAFIQDLANRMNTITGKSTGINAEAAKSVFQGYIAALNSKDPKAGAVISGKVQGAIYDIVGGKGVDVEALGLPKEAQNYLYGMIGNANKSLRTIDVAGGNISIASALERETSTRKRLFETIAISDAEMVRIKQTAKEGPGGYTADESIKRVIYKQGYTSGKYLSSAFGISDTELIEWSKDIRKTGIVGPEVIDAMNKKKMRQQQRDMLVGKLTKFATGDTFGEYLTASEDATGARAQQKSLNQANAWVNMLSGVFGVDASKGREFIASAIIGNNPAATLEALKGMDPTAKDKMFDKMALVIRDRAGGKALQAFRSGSATEKDAAALQSSLATSARAQEAVSYNDRIQANQTEFNTLKSIEEKIKKGGVALLNDADDAALAALGVSSKDTGAAEKIVAATAKRGEELTKEAPMNTNYLLQQVLMNLSGKGTSATVSPPIMNYWNNRWAL